MTDATPWTEAEERDVRYLAEHYSYPHDLRRALATLAAVRRELQDVTTLLAATNHEFEGQLDRARRERDEARRLWSERWQYTDAAWKRAEAEVAALTQEREALNQDVLRGEVQLADAYELAHREKARAEAAEATLTYKNNAIETLNQSLKAAEAKVAQLREALRDMLNVYESMARDVETLYDDWAYRATRARAALAGAPPPPETPRG